MKSSSIGIVGAGTIGCFIGAHMAAAGAGVLFVGRNRIGALARTSGLKATNLRGLSQSLQASAVEWTDHLGSVTECDIILVTVKSQDTEGIAKDLSACVKPGAVIISFQNGVRNEETLRKYLPDHIVLSGMVPYNVVQVPDQAAFVQTTAGTLYVDAKIRTAAAYLLTCAELSGLDLVPTKDIRALQWGKLMPNLINALNALAGIPLKQQFADRNHRRVISAALQQALGILKIAEIRAISDGPLPLWLLAKMFLLPNAIFQQTVAKRLNISDHARLSMYQDLNLRRTTEVDFLNGEIVRLALEHGTTAPIHEKIVVLIKLAEQRRLGSPHFTAAELAEKLDIR